MSGVAAPTTPGAENVDPAPQQASDAKGGPPILESERGASKQEVSSQPHPQPPPQPQDTLTAIQHAFSSQLELASSPSSYGRHGHYNMAPLANALPPTNYRHGQYHQGNQHRYHPASTPSMVPQMPPVSQYAGPSPVPMGQGYYIHQSHMTPYYATGQLAPSQVQSSMPPRQNVAYYPNPVQMGHPQTAYYYPQSAQYPGQHQNMPANVPPGHQYPPTHVPPPETLAPVQSQEVPNVTSQPQKPLQDDSERRKGSVRGPPRKPRQNGNAVWIGNLPPQTDLMSLVQHVCKETQGLESLFLISKSNCAFANYKDEQSCATAQQKLHESKFQSVRLVSRLRKNAADSTTGLTPPTGPAAGTTSHSSQNSHVQARPPIEPTISSQTAPVSPPEQNVTISAGDQASKRDRFFIMKSLTMDDLELSVRMGAWATQSHNEETLSNAYKNCDNVYLVFSANKSGEYFGYARMSSEISEDGEAGIIFTPTPQNTNELEVPKAIPTDATEYAPRGRIIDDSSRGTIFWEMERDEEEIGSDDESEVISNKGAGSVVEEEERTWGKPFRVEWLSTNRLPFYRTRGLRNPWNSNREVKIARDGTELEPSVGRRLIGLFNRLQSPRPPANMHPPINILPGYQQMRPYGQ
ncbi:Zinc finger CCCH domain-containing protein 45 [Cladobotryum mycophilum]|uniref:Zinc finger CCCH domain-containing protein 45 n=1 Tax=Cladobotryum mycophilum TaxID=491253 RepID=A0ABR0S5D8_9HYPO